MDWIGKAFCVVGQDRPEYANGARGAYVVFACRALSLVRATEMICKELSESELRACGFEHLFDIDYLDRSLSDYEEMLISRLGSYPVQFENVHFFKEDG